MVQQLPFVAFALVAASFIEEGRAWIALGITKTFTADMACIEGITSMASFMDTAASLPFGCGVAMLAAIGLVLVVQHELLTS